MDQVVAALMQNGFTQEELGTLVYKRDQISLRWSLEEGLPNQIYLGSQTISLLILLGDLGPRGTSHEMEVGVNQSAHH